MAVPRPLLLALLGVVLAAALFFVTAGARQGGDDGGTAAAPTGDKVAPKTSTGPTAGRDKPARRSDAAKPKPKPNAPPDRPAGVPAAVARAVAAKRTVVIFFYQRGSAEDDATAEAVDSVRGQAGVEVFAAPLSQLAAYQAITDGVGITQAPSVVIVGPKRNARLVEGFVDRETLVQELADAR